jgi:FkbM family methyltransferase
MSSVKPSSHYFPTVSERIIALELRLRELASNMQELDQLRLYELFSLLDKELIPTSLDACSDHVRVTQADYALRFPRPVPLVILAHITCGYRKWLENKYSLPRFVEVEDGDIVFDCGAYIGGFSFASSSKAEKVYVFEPERENFFAASQNLQGFSNVQTEQIGLFNTSGCVQFNVSSSGVEHSILRPDNGLTLERIKIAAMRIDDFCEVNRIERIDFLKVEAEGVEPEVVEGLGTMRPRKLAIDVSPERNGQSPADEIERLLTSWNYECRRRHNVLFAKRC